MKPLRRNKRIGLLIGGAILLGGAGLLVSTALQRNISYFYTPSEVIEAGLEANTRIRLGGMVEEGNVQHGSGVQITFNVTDGANSILVFHEDILPDLFREGQGVIAQGRMQANGTFIADTILAKHDENYIPKELIDVMEAAKNQS